MAAPGFFRKAALEKLSTPEKLDQLITITGTRAWLSLSTIAIAIVAALLWAFAGKVKTKVDIMGVLLGGEVHNVVATSQGQIVELEIKLGDYVKKDDVVAVIDQPDLKKQIEASRESIGERQLELQHLKNFSSKDAGIQEELIEQRKKSINQQIESLKGNQQFLNQQLLTEKDLLDKGLTTRPQVVNYEQQLESTANQIEGLKSELVSLSSQELKNNFSLQREAGLIRQQLAQERRRLELLESQYEKTTKVRSPFNGEVIEVLNNSGSIVGMGTPLLKLKDESEQSDNIRAVMYVPSQDGKKLKRGMTALVVPTTVRPQEFGFIEAEVTYVSEFPVTQQGMMASMKNDQLVNGLLALGAPFEVHVELKKDDSSYSGYDWTSKGGPEIRINSGTSCFGKVTTQEQPPIALVIPALKKFFDLY